MLADQAIFTSERTRRVHGYHIVARSSGVDDGIVQELTRWGPAHGALAESDPDFESLNFHPLAGEKFGVTRTVYGAPEYSSRGGLQIVTLILVLAREQFAGYDNNPLAVAHIARSLGHLRWQPETPRELPRIHLPDESPAAAARTDPEDTADDQILQILEQARNLLEEGRDVALAGLEEPEAMLARLLLQIDRERRLEVSYTTGLKPSLNRPFRLQCLRGEEDQHRRLESQNITVIRTGGGCLAMKDEG